MKKFLISIDTEGDNFWEWSPGDPIKTDNAKYVQRFQELCNKFGYRPTYLINYEMACDEDFVSYIKKELELNRCEVGMHLHAWNSPPLYELEIRDNIKPGECSYLIEYPTEIMKKKIFYISNFIEKKFGVRPIVHRAGRWATNQLYFELLDEAGYIADCSVTPGMNMTNALGFTNIGKGSDYTKFPKTTYNIKNTSLLEIPMTVRSNHRIKKDNNTGIKHKLYNLYKAVKRSETVWLRPNGSNLDDLIYLVDKIIKENSSDYLMFMLHTSEMMPGGSPTFRTKESIEKLYSDLEVLFEYISKHFKGETIGEYAQEKMRKKN